MDHELSFPAIFIKKSVKITKMLSLSNYCSLILIPNSEVTQNITPESYCAMINTNKKICICYGVEACHMGIDFQQ